MSADDQALLEAFGRQRDEASFRRLYRRHTPMLFAMAVRLCGSHVEAEELTQEAWVRAVERHERFDGRSKYRTWLTGILINCFREAARHHARRPSSLDDIVEGGSGAVIAAFPPKPHVPAEPIDVERALSRLPEGYREVVILHDLNGYTHQEIASLLDIQEGTSKSQLARGRARLRELLTNTAAPGPSRGERGTS